MVCTLNVNFDWTSTCFFELHQHLGFHNFICLRLTPFGSNSPLERSCILLTLLLDQTYMIQISLYNILAFDFVCHSHSCLSALYFHEPALLAIQILVPPLISYSYDLRLDFVPLSGEALIL